MTFTGDTTPALLPGEVPNPPAILPSHMTTRLYSMLIQGNLGDTFTSAGNVAASE